MIKQYIKLFLETSFANQSQKYSDIAKQVADEQRIQQLQSNIANTNADGEHPANANIDIEEYTRLLNRGNTYLPRNLQHISGPPKKRQ